MWARNIKNLRPEARPLWASPALDLFDASEWCRGQDSNLRSRQATVLQTVGFSRSPTPARQRLQRDKRQETGLLFPSFVRMPRVWSPRGDSNPLTYRLQVGCATIAPLGPDCSSPPAGEPLTGHNKIRPPTRRGDSDCSIEAASVKVNQVLRPPVGSPPRGPWRCPPCP